MFGNSPVTKMIGSIISQVDGPISIIPDAISCLSDLNQTTQAQVQGAPALDVIGQTLYSCGKTALKGLLYILKNVPEELASDAPALEAFMEAEGLLALA